MLLESSIFHTAFAQRNSYLMIRGLAFGIFILVVVIAHAQKADTAFLKASVGNMVSLYSSSIGGQTILYTGSEYGTPQTRDDQHPFFLSDDWIFGTVSYRGQDYENVPLLYDIRADQLVTENYYNAEEIVLVSEKLGEFTIDVHRFIRIQNEDVGYSLPATGFYQVLYDGPSRTLARHQKTLTEDIESHAVKIGYDEKTRYFIFRGGGYVIIRSRRALLNAFHDQKAALKQFLKKNKLYFRKDPANTLTKVVPYYDTLIIGGR